MSILPDDFRFSQSRLQDYVECHRRFYLRYLKQLAWPALISEPALENERLMRQGAIFHRLVQQHILGIPVEWIFAVAQAQTAQLALWFQNYLTVFSNVNSPNPWGIESPVDLYPEITISVSFGDHRLVAKYDLIVVGADGRLLIIDWKTSARKPKHQNLAGRLQTRLYPFILAITGGRFVLKKSQKFQLPEAQSEFVDSARVHPAIKPELIEMWYWFAEFPDLPERFPYSSSQYSADGEYLKRLIDQIACSQEGEFDLTNDEKKCAFCVYRSLCNRGVQAGDLAEVMDGSLEDQDDAVLLLDFDQIPEIAY